MLKELPRFKLKKPPLKACIVAVVLLGLVGLAAFALFQMQPSEELETIEREYPVSTGDITSGIGTKGTLHYEGIAQNFTEAVQLGAVFVEQGQSVKAGDKLAQADDAMLTEKLEAAQAELEKAQAALSQAQSAKLSRELSGQKERLQTNNNPNQDAQIAEKRAALDSVQQKIAKLEEDLAQDNPSGDATDLRASLSAAQTERDALSAALDSLEASKAKDLQTQQEQNTLYQDIANAESSSLEAAVDSAKVDVETAQRTVDKLQALKADPYLYANIDGIILSLDAKVGAQTNPEIPVVRIGDFAKKSIKVSVPQSDISKVQVGQEVEFSLDAFGDEKFTGKVSGLSLVPIRDSNPISYQVTVALESDDAKFLEGMSANATLIVKQKKEVLQLSNKAIELREGKQYVKLKNEDGTLTEVEIHTGFSDGKVSEIISGLKQDDIVVVEG